MSKEFSIQVENISKIYRLGVKENIDENLGTTLLKLVKSPIKNFKKYQSLYDFDDVNFETQSSPDNILWALRDVSFNVKHGEILGIIGTNGAGKSTLLKLLSRITPPTCGKVKIQGRISSLLEVGTGFHPELTGRENVYLNGTILGMKKNEIDSKFDEIVDFSGVEKFLDTPVKRYSSGMRVRLAFAVAAHLEPEILIVDEVLAVGDSSFQKKCINKMQDVGKLGRTVLFVSHSMQAISRLCERVILLDAGTILQDGTPHDVIGSYLHSDQGTSACRVWQDEDKAPQGSCVRLRSVRVFDEEGIVKDCYDIYKTIGIKMEYDVLEDGKILLPNYHLFNEEGIKVFMTLDTDSQWRGKVRPKGRYESTAWIPGNSLSEGNLFVACSVITINPVYQQFTENDVIAFSITDSVEGNTARGDWAGDMDGVMRPLLKWTTDYAADVS